MVKKKSNNSTFPFGQDIVWKPNASWIAQSNLNRFMTKHGIRNYDELMEKSINDIHWFWNSVLEDLDIQFFEPYSKIIDLEIGIQFPRWCVGGKLNIIHNCLDKWQSTPTRNQIALIWEGEEGITKNLTYGQLFIEVNRCANAIKKLGFGKGDVVGLFMPMIPELVIAFLAVIKTGGIVLPLFSGFGHTAIVTRLNDAKAKAVFTADGMWRRGKISQMKETIDEAIKDVPSVQKVITVNRTNLKNILWSDDRDLWWHEMIAGEATQAETEMTDAEDPLMIIYTSGTTGKPKGAVHTHCGFPIKAAQDMYQSMDLKAGEVMYWMSDMGWMMGPWEVFGTLLIGATMVFYDGAPDYPAVDRLWELVEKHRITHLGITPSLIRALMTHGNKYIQKHDVNRLRMVGSTGSPWDSESWQWVFQHILHGKKPIINYSGGTEISGGILCGNFFKPLKPCAFSGPVPGMAADVVDEDGVPVRNAVGELVIRKPWIGMTRGFWQDKKRYLDAYWNQFPDTWVHGDYAAIDEDGLWYILGRSDDTIKVAGKRLGPAEVESIVNSLPFVEESAAIGVPDNIKGEVVVVFCVLREETDELDKIRRQLMDLIIGELGKPLKPKEIKFVDILPKTRNTKIMHRIIRSTYLNEQIGDYSSLKNPAAIEAIKNAY